MAHLANMRTNYCKYNIEWVICEMRLFAVSNATNVWLQVTRNGTAMARTEETFVLGAEKQAISLKNAKTSQDVVSVRKRAEVK